MRACNINQLRQRVCFVPLVLSSNLFRADIMRRFLVPVVGDGVEQQGEARLAAVAADHELPWPPQHVTPKRERPSFDAEWFRAVQGRLLADGDLPCHWQTPWAVAAWDGRGQEASRT